MAGAGTDSITDFAIGDRIRFSDLTFNASPAHGDGSGILAGDVQLATVDDTTILHIGLDGSPGSDMQIRLAGSYIIDNFALSDGDLVYRNPTPPPAPAPPVMPRPTVSTSVEDGVVVSLVTVRNSDGSQTQTLSVPTVMADRVDSSGGSATADITLVQGLDQPLLSVSLPEGLSLRAMGTSTAAPSGVASSQFSGLMGALAMAPADKALLLEEVGQLIAGPQAAAQTLVQLITPASSSGMAPEQPITLSASDSTVLIIDARQLPPEAAFQLNGVSGAAIIGSGTVAVFGNTAVWGDSHAQTFLLAGHGVTIDAGGGSDHAAFSAIARSEVALRVVEGALVIQPLDGSSAVAQLRGIETLQFGQDAMDLTTSEIGSLIRLYQGAFGRAPDADGINFWLGALEQGTSLVDVAAGFSGSAEFTSLHGDALDNTALVDALYAAVLGREADAEGRAWHVAYLENGGSAAQLLLNLAESAERIVLTGIVDSSIETIG